VLLAALSNESKVLEGSDMLLRILHGLTFVALKGHLALVVAELRVYHVISHEPITIRNSIFATRSRLRFYIDSTVTFEFP
jgi:hypothetical protein